MAIKAGDTALAVRRGAGWRLHPLEEPVVGEAGVAVRTPVDWGVFAAKAPEVEKKAFVVPSPAGKPAVIGLPPGDEDDDDDDDPIGGEPCIGGNPLCSRLYCANILFRRYTVSFSGFDPADGPAPLAGSHRLAFSDDCTWTGNCNGWELRLFFYFSGNQIAWEASAYDPADELVAAAHTTYTDSNRPEQADFVVVQTPGGSGEASPAIRVGL